MSAIPWIESPFFEEELADAYLSDDLKAFAKSYADNGYVIFDPRIDPEILDCAVSSMTPRFRRVKGPDKRIQDAWRNNLDVWAIATDPEVMSKLRFLYGREPIPFQTLSFPEGTQQATHSDLIHFGVKPDRFMCGVWIALEEITNDNGPLHYYPGSHKLKFWDLLDIGIKASDMRDRKGMMYLADKYTDFIQHMIDSLGLKKSVLNIPKGHAIIWAANLLHGGEKILRPRATRYSQVTHYYFEDCMYYIPRLSDMPINKIKYCDITNIKTGETVKSTYFGDVVGPSVKERLGREAHKMLQGVAGIFPSSVTEKIKSLIK